MASRDIYLHHVYELKGRTSDPKQVVKFGRIVLLVLMVVTLVIVAIKPASITDYAYKLSSLVAVSMFTTVPEEIVAKYHKRIDSIIYSGAELTSLTDATIASVNAKAADAR